MRIKEQETCLTLQEHDDDDDDDDDDDELPKSQTETTDTENQVGVAEIPEGYVSGTVADRLRTLINFHHGKQAELQ